MWGKVQSIDFLGIARHGLDMDENSRLPETQNVHDSMLMEWEHYRLTQRVAFPNGSSVLIGVGLLRSRKELHAPFHVLELQISRAARSTRIALLVNREIFVTICDGVGAIRTHTNAAGRCFAFDL